MVRALVTLGVYHCECGGDDYAHADDDDGDQERRQQSAWRHRMGRHQDHGHDSHGEAPGAGARGRGPGREGPWRVRGSRLEGRRLAHLVASGCQLVARCVRSVVVEPGMCRELPSLCTWSLQLGVRMDWDPTTGVVVALRLL